MKTANFTKLIQSFTGRDFEVNTNDIELENDCIYQIYRVTPITKIKVSFDFKTPKNEESIIKSFISTFCRKYREPNPENYNGKYGQSWLKMTDNEKEFAYYHHSSNMYSSNQLLEQIKLNLNSSKIEDVLCQYGFYSTLYGVGIFVLFSGEYELKAIDKMRKYLSEKNILFTNEFSGAKWVYRFVININKDIHSSLLNDFKF